MTVDGDDDLVGLKEIGRICRKVLTHMGSLVRPGITTMELDAVAGKMLADLGARSAPKLAYDFPGHTCISVGSVVAHGVPNEKPLVAGDLINIDVSAEKDGYFGDCGESFAIGTVSDEANALLAATKMARDAGISAAKAGRPVAVIGRACSRVAVKAGFKQVAGLHSHGVGRWIHEGPDIPTIYDPSKTRKLAHGDVITVEPFLSNKSRKYFEGPDGWSLILANGGIGAQFEHSFVVTRSGPILLTV